MVYTITNVLIVYTMYFCTNGLEVYTNSLMVYTYFSNPRLCSTSIKNKIAFFVKTVKHGHVTHFQITVTKIK